MCVQRLQSSGQNPNLVSTRPDLSQDVQAVQDMVRAVSERHQSREERRGSRTSTTDGDDSERRSSRKKDKERNKLKSEEEETCDEKTKRKGRTGKDAKKHKSKSHSHHAKRSEESSSERSDDSSRRPSGASFVSFTSNSEQEKLQRIAKRKKKRDKEKEKEEKHSRKSSEDKPSFLKKVLSAKSLSTKRSRENKERSSDEHAKGSPVEQRKKSGSASGSEVNEAQPTTPKSSFFIGSTPTRTPKQPHLQTRGSSSSDRDDPQAARLPQGGAQEPERPTLLVHSFAQSPGAARGSPARSSGPVESQCLFEMRNASSRTSLGSLLRAIVGPHSSSPVTSVHQSPRTAKRSEHSHTEPAAASSCGFGMASTAPAHVYLPVPDSEFTVLPNKNAEQLNEETNALP